MSLSHCDYVQIGRYRLKDGAAGIHRESIVAARRGILIIPLPPKNPDHSGTPATVQAALTFR